jgi:3-deoxy-D-manno-octulosonic-acid transferase
MRLFGWLLNLVYAGLLTLVLPLVVWRALRHGRYRAGWRERLWGLLPESQSDNRDTVWLHGVSVGEVLLLRPLVERLQRERPDLRLLVTTSTDTGLAVAREKLSGCTITWMPLDFTWSVRRALRRVRPCLCVLSELELWPNFILAANAAGVPLALVNGRLSDRSFAGYRRLQPLVTRLLRGFDRLAVQDVETRDRFAALGAPGERLIVTGSLKFDGCLTDRSNPATLQLRSDLGLSADETVFVAGSTAPGEEAAVLGAWERVRRQHPRLRLILVPRHRERFEEVAALVTSRGWTLRRRSGISDTVSSDAEKRPVILIDTMGELGAAWGLADFAFVGGSLFPGRGGQSMIDPAAFGAAVMFGPHTDNFRTVVGNLLDHAAARVVADVDEIERTLRGWLNEPPTAAELGRRANELAVSQQGATERTVEVLSRLLPDANNVDISRRAA